MSNALVEQACSIGCRTGHDIRPLIQEITLRSQLPANFRDNARLLTNAKRRIKRQLEKAGFHGTAELIKQLAQAGPC